MACVLFYFSLWVLQLMHVRRGFCADCKDDNFTAGVLYSESWNGLLTFAQYAA